MTNKNPQPTVKKVQALLRSTISTLAENGQPYGILDFPDYSNIGDSAIFLGELTLLRAAHCCEPSYMCSFSSHVENINYIFPEGPLYLNGGGNFGDLWAVHQEFREYLLQRYPDRKIIQLPQSIHFNDPKALDRCAMAIDRHPDFTMLVRDEKSYDIAKAKFNCQVMMCPDAAYALGELERTCKVTDPLLCMLRTDKESNLPPQLQKEMGTYGPMEDWVEELQNTKSTRDRLIEKLCKKAPLSRNLLQPRLCSVYEKWARARVDRGIAQLSKADCIITDRLHVHILSTLLKIPHIVCDNNYGKLSRYINAWPKDKLTTVVNDIDELLSVVRGKMQL